MKHEHMPALNRYTSKNQYEALQEIDKTGSLVGLITQGRMGTTIGALIRSAWMDSEVITNEQGVSSERWFVTEAGRHAMNLYEIKREQDRKKAEAEAECRRIREVQRQQQIALEQETLELLTDYFMYKEAAKHEVNKRWNAATTAGAKANVDRVKFTNMMRLAQERAGVQNRRDDPDW